MRAFCFESDPADSTRRLRSIGNDPDPLKFWKSCIESAPWDAFLIATADQPTYLEPQLSSWFGEQFEGVLTAAENGSFPVVKIETQAGLLAYVRYLSANAGRPSVALLRRTVALREHAPDGEPEPAREARQRLITEAGRELKLDEFFR